MTFFRLFCFKPSYRSGRGFPQIFVRPGIGPIDFGALIERRQSLDQGCQLGVRVPWKMAQGLR